MRSSSPPILQIAHLSKRFGGLTAGDTVELQGYFRAQDGYFAADQTSF